MLPQSLKESEGFTKIIPSIITFVGYSFAFYFLSLTLKDIPIELHMQFGQELGYAYYQSLDILDLIKFLDLGSIIGILLIGLGVIVINIFSKTLH